MPARPNCCQAPSLRALQVVDEMVCGTVVLQQCDACQTYLLAIHGQLMLADGSEIELESISP
jgi:hypothetical protein